MKMEKSFVKYFEVNPIFRMDLHLFVAVAASSF